MARVDKLVVSHRGALRRKHGQAGLVEGGFPIDEGVGALQLMKRHWIRDAAERVSKGRIFASVDAVERHLMKKKSNAPSSPLVAS
jgi:hypothetical protein